MKKLLSIILVLAMLLGMTALPVFADTATPKYVVVGESIEISAADTTNTGYAWALVSGSTSEYISLSTTTSKKLTVDGKAENLDGVRVNCTLTSPSSIEYYKVIVVKDDYDFVKETSPDLAISVKDTTGTTLKPTLSYKSAAATGEAKNAVTIDVDTETASEKDIVSITKNSSGTATITGKKAGSATIVFTAKVGDYVVATCEYVVTVSGIDLEDEVYNGDDFDEYDDKDDFVDYFIDEIEDEFEVELTASEISYIHLTKPSQKYGKLIIGGTTSTEASNDTNLKTSGVVFESVAGAIGDMVYGVDVETTAGKHYYGTWTITVKPYDEIDEEQDALFAREEFDLEFPSGIKYMYIVNDADDYDGIYGTTSSADRRCTSSITFDPSSTKYETKNNNAIVYVVGLDSSNVAYAGTITLAEATYDIKYIGEKDKETEMVRKDFEGILEDIFDEQYTGTSTDYIELDTVTFPSSSSKAYTIYNNDKKVTSSAKVKAEDISDITIEPLTSKNHFIDVTLIGTIYDKNDKVVKSNYTRYATVMISAVAGDVKYSVVAKSSVQFNEYDFEDFFEDAVDSSSAILQYIVLDTSDLKSTVGTVQVPYSVGKASVYSAIEDNEKLYFDEDDTTTRSPYVISDARFTAAGTVATGTKVYIPFTAYGKKGSTSKTADGYVEITIINNPFTDLTASWYKDAVLWAYGHTPQITKGTNLAGTLFSPDQACTRAQAVTFLYRAAGAPTVSASEKSAVLATFKDVNATKHKDFVDAIAWAKAKGITSGTSATTFGPDKTCTRAQIVTFIYNYAKSAGKSVATQFSNGFIDVKPTTTHKSYANAIQWAVEQEITNGINTAGTLFGPDQTCTRGHIVTFLYNYFN